MAYSIEKSDWSEAEEDLQRDAYWQFLVEKWLWQVPYSVPHDPEVTRVDADLEGAGSVRELPSTRALEDYSWVMEPASPVSH